MGTYDEWVRKAQQQVLNDISKFVITELETMSNWIKHRASIYYILKFCQSEFKLEDESLIDKRSEKTDISISVIEDIERFVKYWKAKLQNYLLSNTYIKFLNNKIPPIRNTMADGSEVKWDILQIWSEWYVPIGETGKSYKDIYNEKIKNNDYYLATIVKANNSLYDYLDENFFDIQDKYLELLKDNINNFVNDVNNYINISYNFSEDAKEAINNLFTKSI